MKKFNKQVPRFLITFIFFMLSYVYSSACVNPPDPVCEDPPSVEITVCNASTVEVTFQDYTTFGSMAGEYCACGFNMPSSITQVLDVRLVDASTDLDIDGFEFTPNSATAAEFSNLTSGNWTGFSSSVTSDVPSDISLKIIFLVVVSACDNTTLEDDISGINAIGTGGADTTGVPDHHVCVPPPPVFITLPLELSYFDGYSTGKAVQLTWETLSEKSNDYFSIQRSSNGVDFKEIAQIQGAGDSNASIDYTYVDKTPAYGINYYRLRQVDFEGSFKDSKMVSVKSQFNYPELVVYPNPVQNGEITLYLPYKDTGEASVEIYNCVGTLMHRQSFQTNSIQLNTPDLPPGIYIVSVRANEETFLEKMVVN